MKIALFADTWLPNTNGVVYSMINEVRALQDQHEFVLFVPKEQEVYLDGRPDIRSVEFRSIAFPGYPGYNIALPDSKLRKIIQKERFDLVHSHTPFSMWLMAKLLARVQKIPFIQTFHTWISEYAGHFLGGFAEAQVRWLGQPMSWWITRFAHNGADASITPSKILKLELERHDITSPIFPVPSAISSVFFKRKFTEFQKEELKVQFKERFGIPRDSTLLMYVGRVSFEKRLELLLHLTKRLQAYNSDIYFAVVGDGPHLQSYRKLARKLRVQNRAIFTGFVDHYSLPRVYSAADLFVAPSDTETQGLTLVEAMSQRTPVISVKAGGVIDYIRHEKNGLFVPPRDVKALEEAVKRLLTDSALSEKLGNEGYQTAQNYTPQVFAERLNKIFDFAIENHKAFR
ncbi:MAG: glycosyltransferase [Candidatus Thorarchaeota archaeon]